MRPPELTCLQCDERRPICRHCDISRRECYGWASIFQLGYQPTSRAVSPASPCYSLKFQKPLSIVPRRHCSQRPRRHKNGLSSGQPPRLIEHFEDDPETDSSSSLANLALFPLSPAERLAGKVVHLMENGSTNRFNVLYFGAHFEELPRLIGTNVCLDSAVECFLLAQQRLGTPKFQDSNCLLRQYGKSLKLLQTELDTLQPQNCTGALAVVDLLLASEVSGNKRRMPNFLIKAKLCMFRSLMNHCRLTIIGHMLMECRPCCVLAVRVDSIPSSNCSFSTLLCH